MKENKIETSDPVPGDIDWAMPEPISQEEFLRRWKEAQADQPSPVEQVEQIRSKLPIGFGRGILLDNATT